MPLSGAVLGAAEKKVLAGMAAGLTNKEIAKRRGVSPSTIETQRRNILKKLGVSTRGEAAEWFIATYGEADEEYVKFCEPAAAQSFAAGVAELAPRELEMLGVIADHPGWSDTVVASHLQVTLSTVRKYKSRIRKCCLPDNTLHSGLLMGMRYRALRAASNPPPTV